MPILTRSPTFPALSTYQGVSIHAEKLHACAVIVPVLARPMMMVPLVPLKVPMEATQLFAGMLVMPWINWPGTMVPLVTVLMVIVVEDYEDTLEHLQPPMPTFAMVLKVPPVEAATAAWVRLIVPVPLLAGRVRVPLDSM